MPSRFHLAVSAVVKARNHGRERQHYRPRAPDKNRDLDHKGGTLCGEQRKLQREVENQVGGGCTEGVRAWTPASPLGERSSYKRDSGGTLCETVPAWKVPRQTAHHEDLRELLGLVSAG